jgi:hypothetical protein
MYEGIDTLVLHDELALEDSLPFAWKAGAVSSQRCAETNLRVLQACLALDDQANVDNPDEATPQSLEFARLDSKLNLMLDMLGRLLAQNQLRPPAARLRFNVRGGEWQATNLGNAAHAAPGTAGVLEVYLRDCLSDPLRLAGHVESVTNDTRLSARFDPQPEAVANLLSKFIFREHRRRVAQISESRKPKRT